MKDEYKELLKQWCDRLLELQVDQPENLRIHGGIFCPACLDFHGRSWEAVYPLLYLYQETNAEKYLTGAKRLFDWGENFSCDDGSFYNGMHNSWAATTVFAALALHDALTHHGRLLDPPTFQRWEQRLANCCRWIYDTIDLTFKTNINYFCGTAAIMAVAGEYFNQPKYLKRADQMGQFCRSFFDQDQLFTGEGKPFDEVTKKGCRPVDIGYNVEESLGLLLRYARTRDDRSMLEQVRQSLYRHLEFMLPDGGWDNSFGTRNFKWTYWGSRTSGGCQSAYGSWGNQEPELAKAAFLNLLLMKACTHDGLLYGGPDYQIHQELPCVHHTFSHAVGLTEALAAGANAVATSDLALLSRQAGTRYFNSLDSAFVRQGDFYATVTGYDCEYIKGGHASGGTLSMLWHQQTGPIIASAMTDYALVEAHNMQLSLRKREHRSLTPRLEARVNDKVYAQCYDYQAAIRYQDRPDQTVIEVTASLTDQLQTVYGKAGSCRLQYQITAQTVTISGTVATENDDTAHYILPVIGRAEDGYVFKEGQLQLPKKNTVLVLRSDQLLDPPQPVFNLAGGFEAWECLLKPDNNGYFAIAIYLQDEIS